MIFVVLQRKAGVGSDFYFNFSAPAPQDREENLYRQLRGEL